MNGASVEHSHDLANKVFGNEISEGQNLCADELNDLNEGRRNINTLAAHKIRATKLPIRRVPRHPRLHSSEILEWRDYPGECCKRTKAKNSEFRFCEPRRSRFKTRLHLLVKRKSSKAFASSGHIVSNFPEEACCRATGSPMDSTLSSEETASFQVLSDGQAYFNPRGIFKV